MPQRTKSSSTDRVFAALANPTRRDVLDLLLDGPRPVREIAERFDMARPSVSEHLRVLREVGLVTEERVGRRRLYAVAPEPLDDLRRWLTPYERFWRGKLTDLRGFLDASVVADSVVTGVDDDQHDHDHADHHQRDVPLRIARTGARPAP